MEEQKKELKTKLEEFKAEMNTRLAELETKQSSLDDEQVKQQRQINNLVTAVTGKENAAQIGDLDEQLVENAGPKVHFDDTINHSFVFDVDEPAETVCEETNGPCMGHVLKVQIVLSQKAKKTLTFIDFRKIDS